MRQKANRSATGNSSWWRSLHGTNCSVTVIVDVTVEGNFDLEYVKGIVGVLRAGSLAAKSLLYLKIE